MKKHNAILITGASQRIGHYLAQQFLTHTPHPVIFTYRTHRPSVDKLQAQGAIGIQADFTQPNDLKQLQHQITQQVSSLKAVIHNASLWAKETDIKKDPSLLQALLDVHITAPYTINQFCIPLLQASDNTADIIAITDANIETGDANQIAYLASKSALHAMTTSFAQKIAPKIKINEIQPGLVIFNQKDDLTYQNNRKNKMLIPKEPGQQIIWESIQYLMQLPNTTGTSLKLFGQ